MMMLNLPLERIAFFFYTLVSFSLSLFICRTLRSGKKEHRHTQTRAHLNLHTDRQTDAVVVVTVVVALRLTATEDARFVRRRRVIIYTIYY